MSEIIERVARAIWLKTKTHGDWDAFKSWAFADPEDQKPGTVGYTALPENFEIAREEYDLVVSQARAAILAMRLTEQSPPTLEMVEAGYREVFDGAAPALVFNAMIDEALKE